MKSLEGITNKSYTLPGIFGGNLTFAETSDRRSIRVLAKNDNKVFEVEIFITAEQFEAMCSFNSHYDGLEVKPSPAAQEGAVIVTPRLAQSGDRAEYVEPESDPVDAI